MREVHRLFWRAMLQTRLYFGVTVVCHVPAFLVVHVLVPLEIAYGIEAIITRHFTQVAHYAWTALILTVVANAVLAVGTRAFNRNGVYGGGFVQRQIFMNYLDKDYDFYGNNYIGTLGAQAARIRDAFTDYNRIVLFDIPRNLVIIIASLIVLAVNSPVLALITVACMAVVLTTNILFSSYRLKYRRQVSQASSQLAGVLGDALSHGTAVKSFAQEAYEEQRLIEPLQNWEKVQLKSWDLFTPQSFTRSILLAITMSVLLVVSAHLYQAGTISIAIIALVQMYVIRLMNVTLEVSEIIKQYDTVMSGAYQPVATMMVPATIEDPVKPRSLRTKQSFAIAFEDVTYCYPEAAKDQEAVSGFSLQIKQGEKVGLVGYSGGGKTTITKLLLRFMDIDAGRITLDGIDVRKLRQTDVRSAIAYVPQEPLLFHRSIRDNIAYGRPEASTQAIEKAAKTAYVDEFVKALPQGYDTMVGERGVKLSGGQRQRVAIARALLKDAPVLVLDEATSSLDSESEQYIQKALWKLMEKRTAIVIAHRLSTIQRMDRIVVMDQGKIVQTGTHQQLLKDKNGTYARLWAHQSDGYLLEV